MTPRIVLMLALGSLPLASLPGQEPSPLKPGDFVLANVREGTDSSLLQRQLGKPDSVHTEEVEVDAVYKVVKWSYKHFDVSFLSDHVFGVRTTDSAVSTKRGLHVGDSEQRVKLLYGKPSDTYDGVWSYYDPNQDMHVLAVTIRNGRVVAIYVGGVID